MSISPPAGIHRARRGLPITGWNSPGAKRVAHIYWRVMITIVKMLLAIPLTLMLLGSVWLLWFLVTLL
jgi:ABC-type transport system involved in Fe-S cluster assembly fused permease/ATPase subunit